MKHNVIFSKTIQQDIHKLKKKYRQIEDDIDTFLEEIEQKDIVGDRIQDFPSLLLYKARLKNTSSNRGKRGGFRMIYYVETEGEYLMLTIYSKSDIEDLSDKELKSILTKEGLIW